MTFYVSVPENVAFLGSTVNGSIEAAMERYDIAQGLSFPTVNGSIHVF